MKYAAASGSSTAARNVEVIKLDLPEKLKAEITALVIESNSRAPLAGDLQCCAVLCHAGVTPKKALEGGRSEQSRLLSLPPEIRNSIYRLCVVEEEWIHLCADHPRPKPPTLLQICSQVRKEAIDIYHGENTFSFDGSDADLFLAWNRLSNAHRNSNILLNMCESIDWASIIRWAEAYYHGECGIGGIVPNIVPEKEDSVAYVFKIVDKLKRKSLGWNAIELVLEDVRQLIVSREYPDYDFPS